MFNVYSLCITTVHLEKWGMFFWALNSTLQVALHARHANLALGLGGLGLRGLGLGLGLRYSSALQAALPEGSH